MKIGIIGSGNMGRSLGVRFAKVGHQVFFGARRAEAAEDAAALAGEGARAGSNDQAAAFGEVLIWTMPPIAQRSYVFQSIHYTRPTPQRVTLDRISRNFSSVERGATDRVPPLPFQGRNTTLVKNQGAVRRLSKAKAFVSR